MPTVHFLNVAEGDCSIIQHGSGRVSVIDICNGKSSKQRIVAEALKGLVQSRYAKGPSGDYGMKRSPTDPIAYLKALGASHIFRFILSHPDMDHLDGFKALFDEIGILNFWDSGARKSKPDFSKGRYLEADWDHFVKIRDGKCDGVTVVTPKAGSQFQFANRGDPEDRGDCLHVVSPDLNLIAAANKTEDTNDASYVVVYRTCGGRVIFPGDAHDKTWEFVLEKYEDIVTDCAVLIAPHHGRASDRTHKFLDVLNPRLSLFGCAEAEDLGYDAWNSRNLTHITNNQAGNIILHATPLGIEVYVENEVFAQTFRAFDAGKILHGCFYIGRVTEPQPA